MPLYEFHCQKCETDSEILLRSVNWEGTQCPKCGSTRLVKKLSVFASSGASDGDSCGGNSGSCCACGTGRPHRH